ncbi:MAG TPA: HepT-like ribonuclease domain-containing protein [Anaerolineales bacterium]|jgi:uncharacterized protein with HEPN domain
MSPRFWKERVRDIVRAITEIQVFIKDMDFESFKDEEKTIRAVEMNLIIIGEAVSQIPDEIQEANSLIPWSLIACDA